MSNSTRHKSRNGETHDEEKTDFDRFVENLKNMLSENPPIFPKSFVEGFNRGQADFSNYIEHIRAEEEKHSEEEVVVLSYSYKGFKNYVGKNGEKFTVILNKVLKPNSIITIDKDYGDYLLVEEVDGHKHTLSLIGSDGDENLEYPVEFLKNNPTYYVVSDNIITLNKDSKQKVKPNYLKYVDNLYLNENSIEDLVYRVSAKSKKQLKKRLVKVRLKKDEEFKQQMFEKMDTTLNDNKNQVSQASEQKPVRVNMMDREQTECKVLTFDSLLQARKFFQNSTFEVAFYYDFKTEEKLLEEVKPKYGWMQMKSDKKPEINSDGIKEEPQTAYKETEGKLFYELDWSFITQMAERMATNKKEGKYSLWNWKKPMTPEGIEDLKQATFRHLLEVLIGNYEDDKREFGHLEAISANMMMLNYQLKQKNFSK